MTDETMHRLVVRDADGSCYAVPMTVVRQYRVGEAAQREVERALAGDVSAFGGPLPSLPGFSLLGVLAPPGPPPPPGSGQGGRQTNDFRWDR